jgi:hypothetical protein
MHIDRFTPDRWLQPDPTLSVFSKLDLANGTVEPMTSEDWFVVWRDATVDPPVPTDIINRIEQARACLAYGFFYYPLYALGVEQLLRVAEAALAVRCEDLNAPRTIRTFEKRIDWIASSTDVSTFDRDHWHALRKVRNETTHGAHRMLLTPAAAKQLLHDVVDAITALFAAPPPPA